MLTVSTVSLIEAHPQHRGVVMLTAGGDSISNKYGYWCSLTNRNYHVTVI